MSSPHQSVPPPESSHIPATAEVTGAAATPSEPVRVIRMTRLAFLGVFLLTMCVFFPIVGWPLGLFWLALLPIGALGWILRTQTTVSPRGLDLRSVFSSRHIDWERIQGVSIPKRGYVRARLTDDTEVPLPAVSYDRLRDLAAASGGRIPDPFAQPDPAEAAAADPETASTEAGELTDAVAGTTAAGDAAPANGVTPADTAAEDAGTAAEDTAAEAAGTKTVAESASSVGTEADLDDHRSRNHR